MKTPHCMTREEFRAEYQRWLVEATEGRPFRCKKCGTEPSVTITYLSLHVLEFGNCAGSGMVEKHLIGWCPVCETEPETQGCLHIPREEETALRMSQVAKIAGRN